MGKRSVLVVGGGARSHALGRALQESPSVGRVVFAPGTSGLERLGFETAPVSSQDFRSLAELAMMEEFDLTVVGPNTPLVLGIVDVFEEEQLPIFGPTKLAAKLEGSKAYARMLMNQLAIDTPRFAICTNADSALSLAKRSSWPRVFKADGLAYGKGVRVTHQLGEVEQALADVVDENPYGLESERIVVEERIDGTEITVWTLTDGQHVEVMGVVRNHPRLRDGEQGPPTRSMGQVSPAPEVDEEMLEQIMAHVLLPTLRAMEGRGRTLRGALFVDLMLSKGKAVVIDYNVRFGDPATQTLISGYRGDFFRVFEACRGQGDLREAVSALEHDGKTRVSLVLVCEGYPERAVRGDQITIDRPFFEADDLWLYEDGVRWHPSTGDTDARIETTGGRVFTIVAAADDEVLATERVYEAAKRISFRGMHYRRDIGRRAT